MIIRSRSTKHRVHPSDSKPPKNHAWVSEILAWHKIQQFNEFKTLILMIKKAYELDLDTFKTKKAILDRKWPWMACHDWSILVCLNRQVYYRVLTKVRSDGQATSKGSKHPQRLTLCRNWNLWDGFWLWDLWAFAETIFFVSIESRFWF